MSNNYLRILPIGLCFLISAFFTMTIIAAEKDSEKEVIFYTDGRHSSVYLYEPPMSVRQYVETHRRTTGSWN